MFMVIKTAAVCINVRYAILMAFFGIVRVGSKKVKRSDCHEINVIVPLNPFLPLCSTYIAELVLFTSSPFFALLKSKLLNFIRKTSWRLRLFFKTLIWDKGNTIWGSLIGVTWSFNLTRKNEGVGCQFLTLFQQLKEWGNEREGNAWRVKRKQ